MNNQIRKQKKKLPIIKTLSRIFGVGTTIAKTHIKNIGLNLRKNSKSLISKKKIKLDTSIENELVTGKQLKNEIKNNKNFIQKIGTYKGLRNKYKYPSRGQRTHTNGKTKKRI